MCRSLLQQETLSLEGTQAAEGLQQPECLQSTGLSLEKLSPTPNMEMR